MAQQTNFSLFKNVRIVLVNTSHSGNIGATARAMKNMGLSRLYLVAPKNYPSTEAMRRSVGAIDVLDNAKVVAELSQAISDCVWVVGATGERLRTIEWPVYSARECVQKSLAKIEHGEIAVVFGRESSGLNNDEIEECNALLHIPTNPDFCSLNLAAAVQVVCYEFHLTLMNKANPIVKGKKHDLDVLANAKQLTGMYQHLFDALDQLGFFGTNNPDVVMRRLKSLFNRAATTQREVSIFRGICSAIQGKKRKRL